MRKYYRNKKGAERGVAIITVVGLLLVVLVFAGGLMAQLSMEVQSVKQHGSSSRALAAADAGIHGMVAAIQDNAVLRLAPPKVISYTYPEAIGPSTTSYTATIDQNWISGSVNYYLITSTGTYDNKVQSKTDRIVKAIVRAQPYTTFASFSINEVNQFGRAVWYRPDQSFNGPVYSGGPMRIDYNDTKGPIFGSTVQTGNTPVWNDEIDSGPPSDPGDWDAIIKGGQKAFTIDNTPLALPQPTDNLSLMSEAYEGDANATTFPGVANGVYINKGPAASGSGAITTGIYVNVNGGNVFVDGSSTANTETLVFTSGAKNFGPPVTVTINFGSPGSTTVKQGSTQTTYSGVPSGQPGPGNPNSGNGAIFVNGNMTFGKSSPDVTLHGDYTFGTPDYAGNTGTIVLNGNLRYFDPINDKTALWADDVIMNTAASNIEVDASIIAGFPGENWRSGTFRNIHCGPVTCNAGDQGTLTIFGGLIENSRGALGVWIGNSHFGFSRQINYDARLAASPPPFNPTTGAFNIVAWDDLGS